MKTILILFVVILIVGCGRFQNSTVDHANDNQSNEMGCTMSAAAAVGVSITYGASVDPTKFRVVAEDGSYSDTFFNYGGVSNPLVLGGAYERAGTYKVTVTHPNLATQSKAGIVVTAGQCHVNGQTVSFSF